MGIFNLLNQSEQELLRDCELETTRGSGPGGTKADTTESAVRITHEPTGLTVSCGQSRSQSDNRRIALRKLKEEYALQTRHRLKLDGLTIPGKLESYFDNGLRVKRGNPHFPFVVKIVLDVLFSTGGRLSETGDLLGVSTNELTRFFKDHPEVLDVANDIREDNDHHPIK